MNTIIFEYDQAMKTRERMELIPALNFPKKWNVRIIPPFGGATIRFQVSDKHTKEGEFVSIYLDMDSNLGSPKIPYWEVYPAENDDVMRWEMNCTKELMKTIKKALKHLRKDA